MSDARTEGSARWTWIAIWLAAAIIAALSCGLTILRGVPQR